MSMAQWTPAQTAFALPDPRTVQWFCPLCAAQVKNMKFRFCKRCSLQFCPPSRKCSTCKQPCHSKQCRGCYTRHTRQQKCATDNCSAWRQRGSQWCRQCHQIQNQSRYQQLPGSPPETRHRARSRRRDNKRHGHRRQSRHSHDRDHNREEHKVHDVRDVCDREPWQPAQGDAEPNDEVVDTDTQSVDTQSQSEMAQRERDVDALVNDGEDEDGMVYDSQTE